jgi:hypothetical protein
MIPPAPIYRAGAADDRGLQQPGVQPTARRCAVPAIHEADRVAMLPDAGPGEDLWQLRWRAAQSGATRAYEAAADGDPMLQDLGPADERLDILVGPTELDLALRAGSARWAGRLREAGFPTEEWTGLEAQAFEHLPFILGAQNAASFSQAVQESGMPLEILLKADRGMVLLRLAARIASEDLARQWLQAHPGCIDAAPDAAQRSSVFLPAIQTNSVPLARLLIDAGARPRACEVLQADGERREMLERAYARPATKERD